MDEENRTELNEQVESNQQVNNAVKKFDLKKYVPIIGGIVAIIIIVVILIAIFGGGPKKAIKQYIIGMNKQNASKIIKSMDFAGMSAWGYYYDEDDFSKDDYDDFIDNYEDIDKDEIKDLTKELKESMEKSFDNRKDEYKSFKIKIEKFKDVEELGKNLYAVDAKISILAKPKDKDDKEIDESETITFIVYKNKIISVGSLGIY